MFPLTTEPRSRSLRELMRGAVGTALEFATLGEATFPPAAPRPQTAAPIHAHPHRRPLGRRPRTRRPHAGSPRPQVCTSPVVHRRARH